MLVYDCEIIKGILGKNESPLDGIEYCGGWDDHANMGISVIGAYDYIEGRYRVFMKDNFNKFAELARERFVIGFNSVSFDDKLCKANNLEVFTNYDVLIELWRGAGLEPPFRYPSHMGFGLDATTKANGFGGKTGHGALAPILWQHGEYGAVIDYCLEDVRQTRLLVDRIIRTGQLNDPRDPSKKLSIMRPS